MKALSLLLFGMFLLAQPVTAAGKEVQCIRLEIYRLQRQGSCVVLDMNIDLTGVRLAPDCTVYLYPCLKNGADSLILPPVMLNGPQSDLMYRRRRALGLSGQKEKLPPHVVLREGDHPLPSINYRLENIPYHSWTDSAKVVLHTESPNGDARLAQFRVETHRMPPAIIERRDTTIVHDTVYISVDGIVAEKQQIKKTER